MARRKPLPLPADPAAALAESEAEMLFHAARRHVAVAALDAATRVTGGWGREGPDALRDTTAALERIASALNAGLLDFTEPAATSGEPDAGRMPATSPTRT